MLSRGSGAHYDRLVEEQSRLEFVGGSTFLGHPSLRYERHTPGTVITADYVVENPYTFIASEYSVTEGMERELRSTFARTSFDFDYCSNEVHSSEAEEEDLERLRLRAAEEYALVQDAVLGECEWTYLGTVMVGDIDVSSTVRYIPDMDGSWTAIVAYESGIGGEANSGVDTTDIDSPLEHFSEYGMPGKLITDQGLPNRNWPRFNGYSYIGIVDWNGRRALRFERDRILSGHNPSEERGLVFEWGTIDILEENPLLSRESITEFPEGAIKYVAEVVAIEVEPSCGEAGAG